jgi:uncharacterized protein YceK
MRLLALLLLAPLLAGCASAAGRTAAQSYSVNSDGTVSATTRAAADAQPGVTGPQEIIGIQLPLGAFTAKGALIWDGQPWFITGPSPVPAPQAQAAAVCAPQTIQVQETYTEMVPVQRTRTVERQVIQLPVPQAAPQCAPAPQAAPRACSSCVECPGGRCCVVPEPFVVAAVR